MSGLITFGQRIRELREKHQMTQEELASMVDISQSEISKIEKSKIRPHAYGLDLRLANVFKMSVLDLAKETNLEPFIKNERLWPRFCPNHDPTFVVLRIRDGFESQFCPECGKKLEGDCPQCGTPMDGVGLHFCGVCGYRYTAEIEVDRTIFDLESVYFPTTEEYMYHDDSKYVYQARICTSEKHDQNHLEWYLYSVFGFAGEFQFCQFCGEKLLSSCPQCGKPIVKFGSQEINFCDGCGLKLRESGKEGETSSST